MKKDHQILLIFSLLTLGVVITILVLVVILKVKGCKIDNSNGGGKTNLKKASVTDINKGKTFVLSIKDTKDPNSLYVLSPNAPFVEVVAANQLSSPNNADLKLKLSAPAPGGQQTLQFAQGGLTLAQGASGNQLVFSDSSMVGVSFKSASGNKVIVSIGTSGKYLKIDPSTGIEASSQPHPLDAYLV